MTDAFAKLVGPVFQVVIEFQQALARGEQPARSETRTRLEETLLEAEQRAATSRELTYDFALAKHALVYWIDEVLINSDWEHAGEWRERILEWDIYHQRLGGEAFYEHAQKAEGLASTDPLETFLICVCLGFQGRYTFNRSELQTWIQRIYNRIAQSSQHPERFIPEDESDAARTALMPMAGRQFLLGSSVLASISVLLTVLVFVLVVQFVD